MSDVFLQMMAEADAFRTGSVRASAGRREAKRICASQDAAFRNAPPRTQQARQAPEFMRPGTRHDPRAWPRVRAQFRTRFAAS